MIRTILADNQKLFRQTLKSSLEATAKILVVDEVEQGADLVTCYTKHHPDLVIIDPLMDDEGDGRALSRLFQYDLSVKVMMVTMVPFQPHRLQVFGQMVSGFFSKRCELSELIGAIEEIDRANRSGRMLKTLFSEDVLQQSQRAEPEQSGHAVVERLSKREFQIFSQLLNGKQTMDIAQSFFISPKTVSVHKSNIMKKLGVRNNMDLFKVGVQFGMVSSSHC